MTKEESLILCEGYFKIHSEKISTFLFTYFQIESYLTLIKPSLTKPNGTLDTEKLKKRFSFLDRDYIQKIFGEHKVKNIEPLRKHRNRIVHRLNERFESMNYVVENYSSIIELLDEFFVKIRGYENEKNGM